MNHNMQNYFGVIYGVYPFTSLLIKRIYPVNIQLFSSTMHYGDAYTLEKIAKIQLIICLLSFN